LETLKKMTVAQQTLKRRCLEVQLPVLLVALEAQVVHLEVHQQ